MIRVAFRISDVQTKIIYSPQSSTLLVTCGDYWVQISYDSK